jgi:hypothetical protein
MKSWLPISLSLGLGLANLACNHEKTPTLPQFVPISVVYVYQPISPPSTPDPNLTMCYHHYAPSNLKVSTSWGDTLFLQKLDEHRYAVSFPNVPTGRDLWLSFIDIDLCADSSTTAPFATRGVSINGVQLRRVTTTSEGSPAVAFTLSREGTVVP